MHPPRPPWLYLNLEWVRRNYAGSKDHYSVATIAHRLEAADLQRQIEVADAYGRNCDVMAAAVQGDTIDFEALEVLMSLQRVIDDADSLDVKREALFAAADHNALAPWPDVFSWSGISVPVELGGQEQRWPWAAVVFRRLEDLRKAIFAELQTQGRAAVAEMTRRHEFYESLLPAGVFPQSVEALMESAREALGDVSVTAPETLRKLMVAREAAYDVLLEDDQISGDEHADVVQESQVIVKTADISERYVETLATLHDEAMYVSRRAMEFLHEFGVTDTDRFLEPTVEAKDVGLLD